MVWHKLMPHMEANLNGIKDQSLAAAPDQIWRSNYEAPAGRESIASRAKAVAVRIARITRNQDAFKAGDKVRVKMSALFSNVRRVLKEGNSKQLIVTYSLAVFTVWRVTRRTGALERNRYLLENEARVVLRRHMGNPKSFYASDLLLVGEGNEEAEVSMAEALKLNKVQPSVTDVVFVYRCILEH